MSVSNIIRLSVINANDDAKHQIVATCRRVIAKLGIEPTTPLEPLQEGETTETPSSVAVVCDWMDAIAPLGRFPEPINPTNPTPYQSKRYKSIKRAHDLSRERMQRAHEMIGRIAATLMPESLPDDPVQSEPLSEPVDVEANVPETVPVVDPDLEPDPVGVKIEVPLEEAGLSKSELKKIRDYDVENRTDHRTAEDLLKLAEKNPDDGLSVIRGFGKVKSEEIVEQLRAAIAERDAKFNAGFAEGSSS